MGHCTGLDWNICSWCLLYVSKSIFIWLCRYNILKSAISDIWLLGERLVKRLRNKLFGQIIIQDVAFFDKNKTGELVNRLSADTTIIQLAATVVVANMLKFGIQVVGGIFALFFISWQLALVMLIPLPLLVLFGFLYGRFVRNLSRVFQSELAKVQPVSFVLLIWYR